MYVLLFIQWLYADVILSTLSLQQPCEVGQIEYIKDPQLLSELQGQMGFSSQFSWIIVQHSNYVTLALN